MNNTKYKSKSNQKRPLSIIVNGINKLGFELADILLQNNGFVIFIDHFNDENERKLAAFPKDSLVSFLDYSSIPNLDEDLKRLDYVFYFNHACFKETGLSHNHLSKRKSYLDTILALSAKYTSKFLLTLPVNLSGLENNNDFEFRKYSETLVEEYIKKVSLNGRILVLGEILGDGMDFECSSKINRIILNAAKGENLEVPRKGMEKEWYIYVLDAAQAIFKAQFSRITSGNKYLVAYDNQFTYISLAYKLQEIEKDSQDIEFYEDESKNVSLNSKLPPSLVSIGWQPKVSLEKALKQSVSSAKIYLLENNIQPMGVVKKVRTLFEINNANVYSDEDNGPVARLIMERRRQEDLARKSLQEGSKYIESNKIKRNLSISDILEGPSETISQKFSKFIQNIQKKSSKDLFKYCFVILILLGSYLFIFSPLIMLLKNGGIILISANNLKTEMAKADYSSSLISSQNINNSLKEINFVIGKYTFIPNLLNKEKEFGAFREALSSYNLYADGLNNITYSTEPFIKYTKSYESNLELKSIEDGYLGIKNDSPDYENLILDAADRAPYLKLGLDKIDKSLARLTQIDYNLLPQFLSDKLLGLNQDMRMLRANLSYLESAKYVPEILGVYSEKNYAILLIDNTDQKNIGGTLTSILSFSILNGGIKEVSIIDANKQDLKFENINKNILNEINLTRSSALESVKFLDDFSSINNTNEYSEAISDFYSQNFEKEIDGTLILNYSALEGIIFKFSEKYDFEVDGVNFSKQNFLNFLKSDDPKLDKKKIEISSALLSQVFINLVSDLGSNINPLFSQIYEEINSQDISISSLNTDYVSYVKSMNLDQNDINNSDIFIKPSLKFITDSVTKDYPSADISTKLVITNDEIFSFKTNIKLPLIPIQELSLCLPLFISSNDIHVENIPVERMSINKGSREQCINIVTENETELNIGWNIKSFDLSGNSMTINLGIGKIKGVLTKLDFNVTSEPEIKLQSNNSLIQVDSRTYSIAENLSSDKSIRLTISK